MRTARREIMPFLATMTHHCKNRELTVAMAATYELETDHVSFVTGSGESTNKVQSIVEDAERLREEAAVEHSGGAFAGGTASGPEASEDEATDDDSGDAQSTLGGESTDDAEEADDDVDSDAAQEDDQQSGLSDFM
jgi:replication factor C large subunit